MKVEISTAIEELKRQFSSSLFTVREDGQGGAYVLIDTVPLGKRYRPNELWFGFQITAQYPYADIYPVFISSDAARVDGVPFKAPVTPGHQFEGRSAIQVSRRNNAAQSGGFQTATGKILKILDFMEKLQ